MHGDASFGELKMTIVRTCAFHFMKNSNFMKKYCQYQIGILKSGFFHF